MTGIILDRPTSPGESRPRALSRAALAARLERRWTPGLLLPIVWGAATVYVIVQGAVLGRLSGPGHLGRAGVVNDILFLLMWAVVTPAILRSASWLPLVRPHIARRLLVHLALATVFVLAINLAGPFLLRLSLGVPLDPAGALCEGGTTFARIFHLALIVYAFILGVGHHVQLLASRRAYEDRVTGLSADLADARQPLTIVADSVDDDSLVHRSHEQAAFLGGAGEPQRGAVASRTTGEGSQFGAISPTRDRAVAEAPAPPRTAPLAIKEDGRLLLVEQSTIDWVEADDDHVIVHAGSAAWRTRETLRDVERRLDPSHFVRIHRSTIVQMARIRELEPWFRGDYVVVLQSGTKLRLSRNHRERLERVLRRRL